MTNRPTDDTTEFLAQNPGPPARGRRTWVPIHDGAARIPTHPRSEDSAPSRRRTLDRLAGGVFVGREREIGDL